MKYLGIDCGSVSVKMACIDENNDLLSSIYLKNKGLIETVRAGLSQIHTDCENIKITGVGITGSGRNFVKILVGGDLAKTEILAHSVATLHYYPDVKTIFDIGGEDCKIITLNKGVMTNFIMNSVCGAGTGSVIDSIASRLGIKTEDVGDIALQSKNRLNFPGKCGVFATSAVVSRLNAGADKSDIMLGICRGLINNYLTLAKSVKLYPPYVFQGATARNKALVKCLADELQENITIPDNCAIMGAIGIAILAKEKNIEKTNFRGWDIASQDIKTRNFLCGGCSNKCEITQIMDGKAILGSVGSRCGKSSFPVVAF